MVILPPREIPMIEYPPELGAIQDSGDEATAKRICVVEGLASCGRPSGVSGIASAPEI